MSSFVLSRRAKSLFVTVLLTLGLSVSGVAHGQTGDVVVNANTSWATGTYNLTSLTVQSGAVLTVGGGSTVTVSGAVVVTASSGIVLQGANNTAQVGGAWVGTGVTINAASVNVGAGSSINADGQGYIANVGPGAPSYGNDAGGSYGGAGGNQAASTVYGSAAAPVDLGSGGGQYQGTAGAGGGAVRLIVSGTLTNGGLISANGVAISGFVGGGAGGSVYVTAGTLTGGGSFQANGGANATSYGSAGGGGRIAVYYGGGSGFTGFAASTASGGTITNPGNGGTAGSPGSVGFFDTSAANGNLNVYQNYPIPANTTATYNQIVVQNGATLTVGGGSTINVTGAITVTGKSNIVVQSVNNTAQVNGTWQGAGVTFNAASVQVDAGSSVNADQQGYAAITGPGTPPYGNDSGGSYGGAGGGQSASTVYGSTTAPVDLGSGGGQYQGTAAAGGGAIRLAVSGTLTNNGSISANGGSVSGFIGGGAGGSLYVTTNALAGSGAFQANGGANATSYGGAGGGGRVAIYYADASNFTAFTTATATGGAITNPGNGGVAGSNGTVGFFDTSVTNSKLSVYQNFTIAPNTNVTYNQITVTNGSLLTIGGGATVNTTGAVLVTGQSSIVAQSVNTTALVNGTWQGKGLTLNAASLQVDAGSTINADQQGYGPLVGPGAAALGTTSGGSFGGAGGGQAASTVYGSSTAPVDLGSGGGQYQGTPGNGGGALRLAVAGTLTNNGIISANGQSISGFVGAGAGGSIYVTSQALAGAGLFQANGGTNATSYGSGGGGGRVAIYYADASKFTAFSGATATGGSITNPGNGGVAGANGTAAFFNTSVANNNVSIYQNYAIAANASVQYNALTIAAGANVTIGGGAQLTIAQNLVVTGAILAQSTNTTTSTLQGRGVKIIAGSVQIDSTGSILADGQGYVAQVGPGAGPAGTGNGGSYGGLGGDQVAATLYGSASAPIDLGSGGGQYQGAAGAGGGAIQIFASGAFTNNGVVSANGVSISGFVGAGAGGSLYIGANTLSGTGTFSAAGGANSTGNGDGGGGGRIAIYAINSATYNRGNISVAGGASGARAGGVGTLVYSNAPVSTFLLPTSSVLHGTVTIQWFTDGGAGTTVEFAGPQTQVIAQSNTAFSTTTFDTTTLPDGAYELRLLVLDSTGKTVSEVAQPEVINNSVVWHSGTLTANDEWTPSRVHALDGNVIIPSGITLTIDAGTIVKALAGAQIIVQSGGTLNALGANGQQVIFTTFDDYTVGGNTDFNQGISLPIPGEWGGIYVQGGGTYNSNANTIVRYAQTSLSGTLAFSTTLLPTQVYQVTGTLVVPKGLTLNMLPGTIVKFNAGAGIDVQPGGTLMANGTLAQPIYLTGINDTSIGGNTNASTNGTPAAPGDWNSILIDGGTASFNFVRMQYGGGPVTSNAQVGMLETSEAANVTIANSTLAYSFFIGLQTAYPNGGGDTVTVTNTTFYGIQDRAINTFGGSTVHIVNDTFDSNASGVFNHGGTVDIANSIVTNSVSTQFGGIGLCCGGNFTAIVNTDSFNTAAGVANYIGLTDPTGSNGNISANPVYMNGPQHDYRPTYGSPAIDAANGTVANYPTTDAYNDPRFNDPQVTPKKGTADVNGLYPDMGAFEFVQTAPSDLDLTASKVVGPSAALVGTQVQVTWTVTNIGQGTAYGPWHDSVYLVTDPGTNPVETLAGTFLEGSGIVLGPGATYSATATVTVPGTVVGPHHWEVKTNVRGEVFEGANTANNTGISIDPVQVDLTELIAGAGATSGSFAGPGATANYKVMPASAQTTRVQLALIGGATGSVQIFVGSGYIPTPQHFDYQQVEFDSPTASVVIPSGTDQVFYITAYAQTLNSSPAPFTIQATSVQFSLTSVSPNSIVAGGTSTLSFTGGSFTAGTTFALVSASGVTYLPTSTFIADSDHADVTFDTTKVAAGSYSAEAIQGTTVTLANAVTLVASTSPFPPPVGSGAFSTWVETPAAFRAGFPATITLHYTNNSNYDIPAPIIYLNATNATVAEIAPACTGCSSNYNQQYAGTFASGLVLGISHQGPAGILPAGASDSISFMATPSASASSVAFYASGVGLDVVGTKTYQELYICGDQPGFCVVASQNIGAYPTAASFCSSLTPAGASPAGFGRACMLLLNNSGYVFTPYPYPSFNANVPDSLLNAYVLGHQTFNGFNALLAADATALSAQGTYEYDAQKLLSYELQKDGLTQFNNRYHTGAFGFGTSHPYDITGDMAGGAPTIHYPDGTARTFPTVSPAQSNVYLGPVGDYGTLTVNTDGSWLLTEADGTLTHLAVMGAVQALDYLQDRDGNKTTVTYTNGRVTGVADPFGDTLSYQYDTLGHITQSTDDVGRITTYAYQTLADAQKSTFLTSVTDRTGTTALTWNEGGKSGVGYLDDSCIATYCEAAIGIAGIAYPDGTHTYFQYDSAGRLVAQNGDNGTQAQSLAYNRDGSLTLADAYGKSSTVALNASGSALAIVDPLGNMGRLQYDGENKLVAALGPQGDSTRLTYDALGNVANLASPIGNTTSIAYTADQDPLSLTEPAGNLNLFAYNGNYQAIAQTYPNGYAVTRTVDNNGRPITRTNRRGHTITYTYTAHNLPLTKTYPDGSQTTYTYDNHLNIQSLSSASGTAHYTYDSSDRLASLTNADGTSLQYTYNANGQRISMTDSTGFVTNYSYDTAGRIAKLTNASGATIVSYTYDSNNRLSVKTLGNGTTTTLGYDAAGHIASVINRSAANAVLSEYDYTFDGEGHALSMTAPTGNLTYAYDLDGQLTSVTTPAGVIQYAYDANGNRSTVTSAGAATNYEANNLNQYTAVGAANYQYDLDGNLVSGNGWTYTYDDENRLLTQVDATDTYSFQYDGLGNRVASTHNGTTTHYLIDPAGYGNVEAEFVGGKATAHYTYGYDLTSSVQADGTTSYYHFDGTGNTTQMTSASGALVNSYVYLPFGEQTVLSAGVTNPFTYNGQVGVRDDGNGLYFMRSRSYNPKLGRFQQQDPTGYDGGLNPYTFTSNAPVLAIDPVGMEEYMSAYNPPSTPAVGPDYAVISAGIFGQVGKVVNLYNGKTYNSAGIGTGAGANASIGHINDDTPAEQRAAMIDDYLQGPSVTGSVYLGLGGGITRSGNKTSNETGFGVGAWGGSWSNTVNNQYIQNLFTSENSLNGNSLFNDGYQNVLVHHPAPPPICGTCITKPTPPFYGPVQKAIDPNGKLTSGYGDAGFVPAGAAIAYTIYFENQSTATAPAQKVTVTDALPANLDLSTLQLTQVAFNNVMLSVPANTQTYSALMPVATDPNPVQVLASLNPMTGLLTFTMQSVDPVTGGSPANPLAGFLPPNNAANAGVGSVTFSIKPKAGLANTTTITNTANIVFDANAAIKTNSVVNTIDTSTPSSAVGSLPSSTSNPAINVTWSGTDPMGSGIASYNIYVSVDGGAYSMWLSATTLTSATYNAYAGHKYSFYSLATNNVGIQQTTPATAQSVTVTQVTPVVTVTPAAGAIQPAQSLSVTISVATSNAIVPTGTVTLSGGGFTSTAVALNAGSATIVIPAGALASGTDTLTATYTPDTTGAAAYTMATGTATVTVGTASIQVTVGTTPTGQSFSVDGTAYTTTQSFTWANNSTHTLATTSPQTANGTQQTFTTWSDGGTLSHTVTATAGTTTYTAAFATAYLLTTGAAPAAGGTVTPATGTYYASGTVVPLTATPAAGYTFNKWTGNVANATSASTTVTLNTPQTVTATFTAIPLPTVTLTPSTLTFTSVAGSPAPTQTVQLSNTGATPLTISSVALTGANAGIFTQTNTCGTTLAAAANCTFTLTFSPTAAGSFSASLTVTDNATGSPQTVTLTGTATAPPTFTLSATPTQQTISSIATALYGITATAQGGAFNNPITFTATGAPAGSLVTFTPSTVTPGTGAATTYLKIQPTATSDRNTMPLWPIGTPVLALLGAFFLNGRNRRRLLTGCLLALLSIAVLGGISGCAGSGSTYNITVTATSGTQTQTTQVSLTVH